MEWLCQECGGPERQRPPPDHVIPVSSQHDGRNGLGSGREVRHQIEPVHALEPKVEHEAPGPVDEIGREKRFGRIEDHDLEAHGAQQVADRVAQ